MGVYKRMLIEEEELNEPMPEEADFLPEPPKPRKKTIGRASPALMRALFPDPVIAHWDDEEQDYFYEGIPNS